jgi:hypothetical protein
MRRAGVTEPEVFPTAYLVAFAIEPLAVVLGESFR